MDRSSGIVRRGVGLLARCVNSSGIHRSATALVAFLAVSFQPTPSSGQTIRGTIVESETGDVIAHARIVMLGEAGDTAASGLSGDEGSFVVSATEWGTYVVSIARLGYHPHVDGPLRLTPGDTVDVSYQLSPLAFRMDPVVVQAAATVLFLQRAGFYHRQRLGFGHHIEPARIELRRDAAQDIADLMVGIPGVRIFYSRSGSGKSIRLTGMASLVASCNAPLFYVDGTRVLPVGRFEDIVRPWDVQAIEIFRRPSEIPAQYGGAESGCGVILIWTRRGAARRRR
jgi:hypothetical protein